MLYHDWKSLVKDIKVHVRKTNHQIMSSDNPKLLRFGFICTDDDCDREVFEIHIDILHKTASADVFKLFKTSKGKLQIAKKLSFSNESESKLFDLLE